VPLLKYIAIVVARTLSIFMRQLGLRLVRALVPVPELSQFLISKYVLSFRYSGPGCSPAITQFVRDRPTSFFLFFIPSTVSRPLRVEQLNFTPDRFDPPLHGLFLVRHLVS